MIPGSWRKWWTQGRRGWMSLATSRSSEERWQVNLVFWGISFVFCRCIFDDVFFFFWDFGFDDIADTVQDACHIILNHDTFHRDNSTVWFEPAVCRASEPGVGMGGGFFLHLVCGDSHGWDLLLLPGLSPSSEISYFLFVIVLWLQLWQTTGSLYFWAAHLAGPKWGPFASWCCAWLEAIGLIAGIGTQVFSYFSSCFSWLFHRGAKSVWTESKCMVEGICRISDASEHHTAIHRHKQRWRLPYSKVVVPVHVHGSHSHVGCSQYLCPWSHCLHWHYLNMVAGYKHSAFNPLVFFWCPICCRWTKIVCHVD